MTSKKQIKNKWVIKVFLLIMILEFWRMHQANEKALEQCIKANIQTIKICEEYAYQ